MIDDGQNEFLEIGQHVGFVDLVTLSGPTEAPIPQRWYPLRVHPAKEFKVMKTFHQRNISGYLPVITETKTITQSRRGFQYNMQRRVTSPLFKGIILIPDFEYDACRWRTVDGTFGALRFGDWYPYLTPKLIEDVRNIEAIGNTPKSKRARKFELGQLVQVTSGPLALLCGRVERFDSRGRLSVDVEIFGRLTPTELLESQIEAV